MEHDDKRIDGSQSERNNNVQMNNCPSGKRDGLIEEEAKDRRRTAVLVEEITNTMGDMNTNTKQAIKAVATARPSMNTVTLNDFGLDLSPIAGYADQPMLPLVKACAPLSDILHELSKYVQIALENTPEEPPGGLTIDESAAIRLYTIEWEPPHRSLYSMLNYTLKKVDREELQPYFKYLKLFLTGLAKLPCVPPLTVWRGVTKNLSEDFPPGTIVTWWAFSSTTTALTVLENNMYLGNTGERTLFSVETINGRTIREHSYFDTEDEILLLPGTHMIVQSQLNPAPDLYLIHLKQVEPEQPLLEPPFEGIRNLFNRFILNRTVFIFL